MIRNKGVRGIGTDIISIARIRKAVARHGERFILHLFTPLERAYCEKHQDPHPRYAGRFAAKEAIIKACGSECVGLIRWRDMEIVNDATGKPIVSFSQRIQEQLPPSLHFFLSISHCEEYATAVAIVTGEEHGTS